MATVSYADLIIGLTTVNEQENTYRVQIQCQTLE